MNEFKIKTISNQGLPLNPIAMEIENAGARQENGTWTGAAGRLQTGELFSVENYNKSQNTQATGDIDMWAIDAYMTLQRSESFHSQHRLQLKGMAR
jgi:hypothetical protein